MSFFLLLFLALVGYFFIFPLIRLGWRVRNARRQMNDIFTAAGRAQAEAQRSSRRGGWSRYATRRRKKIEADVGEYVAFEDLPASDNPVGEASEKAAFVEETETQISDAEWEDIR